MDVSTYVETQRKKLLDAIQEKPEFFELGEGGIDELVDTTMTLAYECFSPVYVFDDCEHLMPDMGPVLFEMVESTLQEHHRIN